VPILQKQTSLLVVEPQVLQQIYLSQRII